MYVVVFIETESDTPGIRKVLGPYHTDVAARDVQRIARDLAKEGQLKGDPELIQVAPVERLG